MLCPLEQLAERRIQEAQQRGEFDDLLGAGQPVSCDVDTRVPPELRCVYRILKNANCLPPEIELLAELRSLESLMATVTDDAHRAKAWSRWSMLRQRLSQSRGVEPSAELEAAYLRQATERD